MNDELFLQLVENDIQKFLNIISVTPSAILLFPPLLSRYRYLIHQFVDSYFPAVKTVSVGLRDNRRTIIYPVERSPKVRSMKSAINQDKTAASSRKCNIRPAMQPLYVPPPQRNRSADQVRTSSKPVKNDPDRKMNFPKSKDHCYQNSLKASDARTTLTDSSKEMPPDDTAVSKTNVQQSMRRSLTEDSVIPTEPGTLAPLSVAPSLFSESSRTNILKHNVSTAESVDDYAFTNDNQLPLVDTKLSKTFPVELHVKKAEFGTSVTSNSVLAKPAFTKHEKTLDLEAQILNDLTEAFGADLKLEHTKQFYQSYSPSGISSSGSSWSAGYSHVAEAYDFPISFSSSDLIEDLQLLTRDFFEVKWVDDTHALVVFASDTIAQKAIHTRSPLVKSKLRPFSEASDASKRKARNGIQFEINDSRQRPETNAATARRMVAGALGMTIKLSKEKQDNERRQLQGAKEEKIKIIKQKEDIWEGRV